MIIYAGKSMKNKAFTLIELIVVIAIIAILAAIIAPNAFKAIEKAKITKAIGDMKAIKTAALTYYADNRRFPCNKVGGWGKDPGFVAPITATTCWPDELWNLNGGTQTCANCIDGPTWDGPYLETWPAKNPWDNNYVSWYPTKGYNWGYTTWILPDGSFCWPGAMTALMNNAGQIPYESLKKIDFALDDGNLSSGNIWGPYDFSGDPLKPDALLQIIDCVQ